jgi:hypothetical protein
MMTGSSAVLCTRQYQLVSARSISGQHAVRRLPCRYGGETLASFSGPGWYLPQLQSVILHHGKFSMQLHQVA